MMVKILNSLSSIEDKTCPQLRTKPGRIDTSSISIEQFRGPSCSEGKDRQKKNEPRTAADQAKTVRNNCI